jgi:vancomycin resistance protein VanJ
VVTFNTDGGNAVAPRLSLLLAEWRADVVAMQECGPLLRDAVRAQAGWYHHETDQLCVLSRYPLSAADTMNRSALAALREHGDIGGAGYVVRYVVDAPAGRIGFVNLHLETPRKGFEALMRGDVGAMEANTRLRDLESDLARRWAEGAGPAAVIAGDFNTPVESRIFARHWSDLRDAFDRAGVGFGYSKYNGWIRVRIDHVLTGRGWRAVRSTVGDAVGSDHRPLIVDLRRE